MPTKPTLPPIVEYEVQGNYGQGWEMVTTEATKAEAEAQKKCYDENEPYVQHRVKKVRVKPEATPRVQQDSQVFSRDTLDEKQRENFSRAWLHQLPSGEIKQYTTEGAACKAQRRWREKAGLNIMTGEPVPDLWVEAHGSIVTFSLGSQRARDVFSALVLSEPYQWQGSTLSVDHRMAELIGCICEERGLIIGDGRER